MKDKRRQWKKRLREENCRFSILLFNLKFKIVYMYMFTYVCGDMYMYMIEYQDLLTVELIKYRISFKQKV